MSKIKTNTLENVAGTYNVAVESLALMSNRNYFINGGFDVWQRGENFNLDTLSLYTADRWYIRGGDVTGGSTTAARGSSRVGGKFAYHISIAHTGATDKVYMVQKIEGNKLSGKTVTLSGEVYVDSVCDMDINTIIYNAGNVASNTYTPKIKISDVAQWVKFSFTIDLFSVVDQPIEDDRFDFYLSYYGDDVDAVGTNTLRFRELQIEEGSVATPFEMLPVALTMVACQRYYERWYGSLLPVPYLTSSGLLGNKVSNNIDFKVIKRIVPEITGVLADGGWNVWGRSTSGFGLYATQNGNSTCSITSWIADAEL